ncbi:hypothetical protein BAE44_0001942 [Dichanthelium oligosanthes]|uniref:Uncharacterized protein n=1 Tax=Dichanthelium oligosanthes TaxID=888268 RepID=A0A1E5WI09_9POAL|nr:hypothetical protein BAE44_0001942 [Dichanthelium oligosanthes]
MIPRLSFYLSFLGSYEVVHTAIRRYRYLLSRNVERVVKPNIAFLQQCGLTFCDIVKIFSLDSRMLVVEPKRVKEIVVCADMLGVPRNSAMFKHALVATHIVSPERISARLDFLKKALGCSEAELGIAVRKLPNILNFTEGRMSRTVDFLKKEVGLDLNYIVHRPALLNYSMAKRLMPRHYVLKVLKAKGLVEKNDDFYTAVSLTEERFIKSPALQPWNLLEQNPNLTSRTHPSPRGAPPEPDAMLRLRSHLLPAVRAASPLSTASSIHRLILYSTSTAAAAAATTPAAQFVVEDYLANSCGLTPAQARKASRYLPHLKSPSNADAVRAFLAGIGVTKADVARAVARNPRILCSRVDETLSPRIAQLRGFGLSPPQISRLIGINSKILQSQCMIPRLSFYLSFLGSYEVVHAAFRGCRYLLDQNVERVVKPNIAFLQQCGLTVCDIVMIFSLGSGMLLLEPKRVKEVVVCADMLGVPRNSAMFKHALVSIHMISPERISARSDFLKKALGCSEAELGIAVRKLPNVLNFAEGRMSRLVDFLKTEVGLEVNYIVHRPALLRYSMTKRLMPRHYVLKALKAKGLVEKSVDFFTAVCLTEERFTKRFLDCYKESVPGLSDAYAAACAGQVPPEIQL